MASPQNSPLPVPPLHSADGFAWLAAICNAQPDGILVVPIQAFAEIVATAGMFTLEVAISEDQQRLVARILPNGAAANPDPSPVKIALPTGEELTLERDAQGGLVVR